MKSAKYELILSIDIGSSSIKCSAFEVRNLRRNDQQQNSKSGQKIYDQQCMVGRTNEDQSPYIASSIASVSRDFCAVEPITGKIMVNENLSAPSLFNVVDDCIDDVLKILEDKANVDDTSKIDYTILGCGITSFVMNLVGVDRDGHPLGNETTLSYACNNDVVNMEVETLRRELGVEKSSLIYQLTGAPIHSAYALAQMRVFYSKQLDESIKALCNWKTVASICLSRWTGETRLPISYSEASWTGLLDFETCQYERTVLDLLPNACQNHLPDLSDFNELPLNLNELGKYWVRWPKLRNTRFFLGVGDGACANVGSGCTTVDQIACTVGTSAAARVCLELPIRAGLEKRFKVESGLFCYRINKTHVLIGGALTDGGSVVEWVRKLLRLSCSSDFQTLMADVKSLVESDYAKEKTHGCRSGTDLTVVPFLSGERSTGFRTGATGAIIGVTRETSDAQLLKACLESVILRIGSIIRLLKSTVSTVNDTNRCAEHKLTIICSGRAFEDNEIWRQMLADCENLDVHLQTTEATGKGIASLILVSLESLDLATIRQPVLFSGEEYHSNVTKSSSGEPEIFSYWNRVRKSQETVIECLTPLYGRPY